MASLVEIPDMEPVANHFRTPVPLDPNNVIEITGFEPVNGVYTRYEVEHESDAAPFANLKFLNARDAGAKGLTNEALLAIVQHRLIWYQKGPFACPENQLAIDGVKNAILSLKDRTMRLAREGVNVHTSDEKKPEPTHTESGPLLRVHMAGDPGVPILHIGQRQVFAQELKIWDRWNNVEKACKELNPPITTAEMSVIEEVVAKIGGGAKNGLAELKQALAQAGK